MYTDCEIATKLREAEKFRLSGSHLLKNPEIARKYCNGIGAAWMPKWMRNLVTKFSPSLILAADIHDIRYGLGGTEADRTAADAEFESNGLRIAAHFKWFDPRRYVVRRRVRRYAGLLREYGQWAYSYREEE